MKCDLCGAETHSETSRSFIIREVADLGVENHFCAICIVDVGKVTNAIVTLLERLIEYYNEFKK